ncbi:MAG: flagellar hook-basal body complex protein FliE [Parvibaculum sp.]|jgi:flagellar hook-basal body complex protein FliE|nr:flagellar hook-basal body complex protein FliE [Parvibaculum sp.]|tara:strand:- start:56 stop:379 length:324 start_codon:yes stop_codon:yes gene_type:complete
MTVPASVALNAYTNALKQVTDLDGANDVAASTGSAQGGFGDMLKGVVENMAATGINAEQQTASAVAGTADVVDVVTAVSEAETTLQTVVAIRDNVITAYQEIMKMPI